MRHERSSPGTVRAPVGEAVLTKAVEDGIDAEGRRLRAALVRRANAVLEDLELPIELEENKGKVEIGFDVKPPTTIKEYEGFDLEALEGDPSYRTETRRTGTLEYVVTERVRAPDGHESSVVRPDAQGSFPDADDVRAALQHDFLMARRWFHQDRIFPDEAALIMHQYHRKPSEWVWRAMEALMAAKPELEPDHAARMSGIVIRDLVEAHRKRIESL